MPYFKNLFFKLVYDTSLSGWNDIEKLYFDELNGKQIDYLHVDRNLDSVHNLNNQFEDVKLHLGDYLQSEQNKFKTIPSFEDFFSQLEKTDNNLILNFNYTDTVSKYSANKTIHIHGELDKKENPIIFGYAANNEESRALISKENNEYMRNIKKHCYKRTSNEKNLISYLEDNNDIDVLILGHSCGISDKLILNQIFNHKNTRSIQVFYYNEYESFYQTQVNIDRIMNNDVNFKKLVDFQSSIRMPQYSDTQEQFSDFQQYITKMLAQQKARKTPKKPQQPKARIA